MGQYMAAWAHTLGDRNMWRRQFTSKQRKEKRRKGEEDQVKLSCISKSLVLVIKTLVTQDLKAT